ncbi:MAG: TIGR04002 family protein [Oscillospiraceae bacterium]|nr:TIGR04002 family protein [Oscillospiraceae bacterium]
MNRTIKLTIVTALFTALVTVFTFFVKIPIANGYIHVGDSIVYLAACILPFPYALIAAGIGGAFADTFGGYVIYIIPTLIIKALITLPYNSKSEKILTKRNALMVIPAGLITVVGYFITAFLFFGWAGAVVGLIGDVIQAAGSAVLFIVFATALDRVKFKRDLFNKAFLIDI